MATERHYVRLCGQIRATDPLVVEAAAHVDRGLLEWMLSLSPRDRLLASTDTLRVLSGFRRDASETGCERS